MRTEPLAVADDGVVRLLAEVVYQEYAEEDALELFEQRVDRGKQVFACGIVCNDGIYHLVVAIHYLLVRDAPCLVAGFGHLRGGNQLVCYPAQRAYYYDNGLFLSLFLYNVPEALDAFHGTY